MATVRHLEAASIDDALELLDLLMSAELLGRAQRESGKENARRHPRLAGATPRLAVAVEALFDSDEWGGPGEEPRVSAWNSYSYGQGQSTGGRNSVGLFRRSGA